MTTFGLVHGAYHGAWCWQRLAGELEGRGHQVRTVDLPSEDPAAGAAAYADAAVAAFDGAEDGLVVVGHSLGGLTIPLIASRRPVGRLVYLCALLPRPGQSHDQVARSEPDMFAPGPGGRATYTGADGATRWYREPAADTFFDDCGPELASWAAARLRGQQWTITAEITPLDHHPRVPTTAIIATHDRVVHVDWARRIMPQVLGVTPLELPSGHSPFLSMPDTLAELLVAQAPGEAWQLPGAG